MAGNRTTVTLPADERILITREFDAPKNLVYRAWTEPELIGHERPLWEEPSADAKSRFYSDTGGTLDYTYELEGDTLTIWFGDRDSPAYFRGTFSDDGDTLAGRWQWPGGGYEATSRRVGKA